MTYYSIITVTKDNLVGLKKTYSSLLSQSSIDWEWIVIDGASSDGTEGWLSSLNDKNIFWISEDDQGIYNAMNKGLKIAGGEYYWFLNSGDYLSGDQVLSRARREISRNEVSSILAYGDVIEITHDGREHNKRARRHQNIWSGMFASHQAMLFNQEVFQYLKFREEWTLSADYGLVCEIMISFNEDRILYLNQPVCCFELGGRHERDRIAALAQDYQIRRQILEIPFLPSGILWILHWLIWMIKKNTFLRSAWYRMRKISEWK